MNKIRIFIFLGLCIGATYGVFLGAAIQNLIFGIGLGALAGVFLGLFIAAAIIDHQNSKKNI